MLWIDCEYVLCKLTFPEARPYAEMPHDSESMISCYTLLTPRICPTRYGDDFILFCSVLYTVQYLMIYSHLFTANHYLDQSYICLFSIKPLEINLSKIFIKIQSFVIHENAFENVNCKMATMLLRHQCVKVHIGYNLLKKETTRSPSLLPFALSVKSTHFQTHVEQLFLSSQVCHAKSSGKLLSANTPSTKTIITKLCSIQKSEKRWNSLISLKRYSSMTCFVAKQQSLTWLLKFMMKLVVFCYYGSQPSQHICNSKIMGILGLCVLWFWISVFTFFIAFAAQK